MAQNNDQRVKTPPPVGDSVAQNGTDLNAPTDLNLKASGPQPAANASGIVDATIMDNSTAQRAAASSAAAPAPDRTVLDKDGVSAMAAGRDRATVIMSPSSATSPTVPPAPAAKRGNDELVGMQMGPARLEKKLGQGGMGMVYLGVHTSLEKKVAVKILPQQLAERSKEYVERFRREAIAAGKLEHQNIVQVYDVNKQDEYYYIIMQFVEGSDLRDLVKKNGKLTVKEALGYTLQIARGLEAAHTAGIVHRDIKPENVLVNRENVAKIADFGLAGLQDSELTREGQAMGSPYYMSPEQCSGSDLDIRTDIYALGVTLYYMLTGTHPYTGQTPLEIMQKHSSADIPSASKVARDVPESVALVIRRMMMKNRDDRYADPKELIADLEALLVDPDAIPAGAMKARPPLVSTQAMGILAATVLLALFIVYGVGGDKGGAGAAQPTISIGGVAIPYAAGKGVVADPWKSPMRIAMLITDTQTENPFIAIQKAQFTQGMKDAGVVVVERESLDKIIGEMAIAQTDLVNKDKAVAIGKLLNAHIMLKLNLATAGNEGMVALECVDIATGEKLNTVADVFTPGDKGRIPAEMMAKMVQSVMALLDKNAVCGSVKSADKGVVTLDIGALHGVKKGQKVAVVEQGKDTSAVFVVESVDELSSTVKAEGDAKAAAGAKVRLLK